jgi:type I restriction enzyme S subunit
MKGWQSVMIKNLCDVENTFVQTGPFGSQLHESDYSTEGIPVIMPKDILRGKISTNSIARVSENHVLRLKKHQVLPGDIVYGRRGDIGRQALIHNNEKGWLCGTGCLLIRTNKSKSYPPFLHYYLSQKPIIDYVSNQAIGVTMPNLNTKILLNIPIFLPPLITQRKIAAVLSAYDDLIENNNRRIAILEKMAEELYREWFVRLRFPGHEKVKIVKGVPEGWEVVKAGKYFNIVKGRSYKSEEIEDYDASDNHRNFITLKNFKRGGGFRADAKKFYCGKFNANQVVSGGSLVLAVTDMTQDRAVIGRIARIPVGSIPKSIISCDVVKIDPVDISDSFLYIALRFSSYSESLKEYANGANVLHLKPELASKQEIILPAKDIRDSFDKLIIPIITTHDRLINALDMLSASHDRLLSRLMSGKLDVEDIDIRFPKSMEESIA